MWIKEGWSHHEIIEIWELWYLLYLLRWILFISCVLFAYILIWYIVISGKLRIVESLFYNKMRHFQNPWQREGGKEIWIRYCYCVEVYGLWGPHGSSWVLLVYGALARQRFIGQSWFHLALHTFHHHHYCITWSG